MELFKKIRVAYNAFLLSASNIEENALKNTDSMLSDFGDNKTLSQTNTLQDMLNGVMTEEVQMIRARYYKILENANNYSYNMNKHKVKPIEYKKDENGEYMLNENGSYIEEAFDPSQFIDGAIEKTNPFSRNSLSKVVTDNEDSNFTLLYSINNTLTDSSRHDEPQVTKLQLNNYNKFPKFSLALYSESLKIREIDSEHSLLEFYIRDFDDKFNKHKFTRSLLNNLSKGLNNKQIDALFNFDEIAFETDMSDKGTKPLRSFIYTDPTFHKMVKFNNYYIIKYKVKNEVVNINLVDKYKIEALEKKYDDKERRNNPTNY